MMQQSDSKTSQSVSHIYQSRVYHQNGQLSSKKSLLTQKVKKYEEDKDRDLDQQGVDMAKERKISQNSVRMTELKKMPSDNNSEPLKLYSSFQHGNLQSNGDLMDGFSTLSRNQNHHKEAEGHGVLTGEMKMNLSRYSGQQTSKEQKGCARCQIY